MRDQVVSLFAHTATDNSRLVFTLFSIMCDILVVVFVVCSNNNDVYAQQSYSPAPAQAPLSQLPQQTNNTGANVPIVLRPLPGGTCPQGYHLVSGTVCIKDLPSATATKTTHAIPATTNKTNASSPLPFTIQQNDANPSSNNNDNSNNEQNFGTKILKSFNQGFK
ncbi:MAG TPA: hypothetical protein VJ729_11440 [Nitrososphaeraceae archaeon]|nr:hypothetical protein [Nitrososphaeraceae archaeon]